MLRVSLEQHEKKLKEELEDLRAEVGKKMKKVRDEAKLDNTKSVDKFASFETKILQRVQEQDE